MPLNKIKMMLVDVDGVLTDGSIILDSQGQELKKFHVRDGSGIVAWQKLGLKFGIITGRASRVTTLRAAELGIEYVEQCGAMDKAQSLEKICAMANIAPSCVAFIGDDLADLPVLSRVGYPIAVADAAPEVRSVAKYVTPSPGGRGAVREAIEHILRATGRWGEVLESYGV